MLCHLCQSTVWQKPDNSIFSLGRDYFVTALDFTAVSIFVVILVKLTIAVFVKSNNITTNIETDDNVVYYNLVLACCSQISYLLWGKH